MSNVTPIKYRSPTDWPKEPSAQVLFWHCQGNPASERHTAEYRIATTPRGHLIMQRLYFVQCSISGDWSEVWRDLPLVMYGG